MAFLDGWARRWRATIAGPSARELDGDSFAQMQRLADACMGLSAYVIYDVAGVSRPQRVPLRDGR